MRATRKSGYPSWQTLYQWVDERVAYFATVFRLTWCTRAVSDFERPVASIDRISFAVSRGAVISSILPGRVRQSNRPGKPCGEGRAPGTGGAALAVWFPGRLLWRARPGRTGEMTVPLDTVNDIRSMDAAGRSRSEAARVPRASRNTVAKYADMGDMSPAAPMPQRRGRPALGGNEEWVMGVLEADLGAPRKQRRTARRIYDRLVAERGSPARAPPRGGSSASSGSPRLLMCN